MERTETTRFARRSLGALSGGEAQRVMIARALAQQPRLMLLDEPTSHLDLRNQLLIYGLLRRLARDGVAVLCVSHDINVAARFADQLVMMGPGRVLARGVARQVLRASVLEQVYGVPVDLVSVAGEDVPMVRARELE